MKKNNRICDCTSLYSKTEIQTCSAPLTGRGCAFSSTIMGKQIIAYVVALVITALVGFAILTVAGLGTVRTCIICALSISIVGTFLPPLLSRLFRTPIK